MNKKENKSLPINLNPNNIKYNINNPININNQQNFILNKKNIDDDSLFNISYSSPKRPNNNNFKVNNYISSEKQKDNIYNNNNNIQDQRLFFTLKMLGLNKYYINFVQNKYNFEGLLALSTNDMDLMGIPKNYQKIIRNFILEYFQFGSLYTLEELNKYFIKKNYSKGHRTIKRSYSYNFQGNKTKRIKNNINSQINLRNQKKNQYNNYNREFDKRNNNDYNIMSDNYIDKNNLKINKSVSPSLKNNYNIYSKINMNNININNIENKINNQYIMNCNNINNDYINNNTHNDVNDLVINTNENKPFSPSLDNFNRAAFEQKKFDIKKMKKFSNANKNMKMNLKQNQIKIITKNHHSNSNKSINQKKDKIWKSLQKKKNNTNILDYKLNNNLNNDIIEYKFDNKYKRYYSYNNNHRNIIKNDSDNITDINYYTNSTNSTNPNYGNRYYDVLNNNIFNENEEYDNYTLMIPRSSSLNSKISKIKMLKMKHLNKVNQFLSNSQSKGKNLYPISAKKKGIQTNILNDGIINNNYNFINKYYNDSISMNNNVEPNNLRIQNMKFRNKNIYYRNIDNYNFNNNYNNFSYNQLNYNLVNQNNNTNNYNDINEIPDFFENKNNMKILNSNNGKQKFFGIIANSSNNSRIKGLEIRYQESREPKKIFNNNSQKNLNIIPNSNKNLNNINSVNTNDVNFMENINNNNYINKENYNLLKSKNKKIKLRQNNTDNYFIKSFQQYYKTTQNFYNEQFQTQSKPIDYSSIKKEKRNLLIDDYSPYNLLNKENNHTYKNNNKIINKNIKKANLPKYISKTQLEKIKMDIQKGFNKGNNNNRKNRSINNKNNNYYSKKQNNIYSSNANNCYNNINDVEYKNNYYNNNFNSKNYI